MSLRLKKESWLLRKGNEGTLSHFVMSLSLKKLTGIKVGVLNPVVTGLCRKKFMGVRKDRRLF